MSHALKSNDNTLALAGEATNVSEFRYTVGWRLNGLVQPRNYNEGYINMRSFVLQVHFTFVNRINSDLQEERSK